MSALRKSHLGWALTWCLVPAIAVLAGSGGCGRQAHWLPYPEETSTRFLHEEVGEALAAVEAAAASIRTDPAAAERAVAEARVSLLALEGYYLPLLETRGLAYNALRWYRLGEPSKALEALDEIEQTILEISDRGDPQLSREFDNPLETAVNAKAAVRAGRADAAKLLEQLSSRINLMLLKGGLVLQGTHLEGS
jgi:hypothetical protein